MKGLIRRGLRFLRRSLGFALCLGSVWWAPSLWAGGAQAREDKPAAGTGSAAEAPEHSDYPVRIANYNYKKEPVQLVFTKAPERVVAIYQNSIETLLALGLEDRIIAAAGLDHAVKPELAAAFAEIEYLTEFTPNRERVIMLQPDFIVGWYSLFNESRLGEVDYWHSRGTNTFIAANSGVSPAAGLEKEYQDMLTLGKIFNVEAKARTIVDRMRAEVDKVAAYAQGGTRKRVLIMETQDKGLRIYGRNALGGDMAAKLGAEVIMAESGVISAEALIGHNPDCIFVVYFGSSADKQTAEAAVQQITGNLAYASLSAVKNQGVFPIPLDGIITLAQGMYPDLYRQQVMP